MIYKCRNSFEANLLSSVLYVRDWTTPRHIHNTKSGLLTVQNDTFLQQAGKKEESERIGTHTATTRTKNKLVVKTSRASEMRANNFIGALIQYDAM